jgi:uncharacterized membrane protein
MGYERTIGFEYGYSTYSAIWSDTGIDLNSFTMAPTMQQLLVKNAGK